MYLDDGKDLIIAVRDTGIGIEKADIPKIQEAFVQIPNHLGSKQCGYGLGLTITKGLAELLNAKLEIASEMGNGTTVSIRFDSSKLVRKSATKC
jgi:signal transduction histidine kinase